MVIDLLPVLRLQFTKHPMIFSYEYEFVGFPGNFRTVRKGRSEQFPVCIVLLEYQTIVFFIFTVCGPIVKKKVLLKAENLRELNQCLK